MTRHEREHADDRAERRADRNEARQVHREEREQEREEWQRFLHDQDDRLVTLHGPVVTGLTKFKRLVIIGLAIAILGVFAALIGVKYQSEQADRNLKNLCIDQRGDRALRHQWERVSELIQRTNLKPTDPRYLPPSDAGKMFADSYEEALKEAGPPPPCPAPPSE
jgi:hypothetical protein